VLAATAGSADAIEDEHPVPNSGFSTTSQPVVSTNLRTFSAAPPMATTIWSRPLARAMASTASSSTPSP
jgi:hypothetical protein